ncbi:MAG: ROK family protein [Propionibacteriaceae bacterium]|jgi:predicted NBD/HSP70 family sugar kinase/DNA-binding LacI/PurR family transcriptional regulator|nr:ROK family protein [Propionibacteriaceae bacterium]
MARRETVAAGPGSRALIVDVIRSSGPISRIELVEATGLTQPSISNIVRKLLDEGVVRETGDTVSTGGKPRTLLAINAHAVYGVGMHLATDWITCVVTDTNGGIVGRQLVAGVGDDPPVKVIERLIELFRSVTGGLGLARSSLAGLAVVGPGPVDVLHGVLPAPRSSERLELGAALAAELGVPVLVDNDAAAAAVGEFWGRQISRERTFGCLYMGHGIGAGTVLDGSLHRGASSNAGELGHITVVADGLLCRCGNSGCLELYAAPPALVTQARAVPGLAERIGISESESDAHAFDLLARSAVYGEPGATELVDASAERLSDAAVTLANLWDLDTLVVAGPGFAVAGAKYVSEIRSRLIERARARDRHGVWVELSSNPRDSAAIGGAALVLQGLVAPGHGPEVSPTGWRLMGVQSADATRSGTPVGLALVRDAEVLGAEPWFHEFIAGIERVLVPLGIPLLLQVVPTVERACERLRDWAANQTVRGTILIDLSPGDERVPLVQELGLPTVVVGDAETAGGLTVVWSQDDQAMRSVVAEIVAAGHTHIGHVAGPAEMAHSIIRRTAFLAAAEELGVAATVFDGDYSAAAGARAIAALAELPEPPSVLLFDNDLMALGALAEATEMGVPVPTALSLVAWDDSALCQLAEPPLSAVGHDVQAMGELVGKALAGVLAGEPTKGFQAEQARLVMRGSTARTNT